MPISKLLHKILFLLHRASYSMRSQRLERSTELWKSTPSRCPLARPHHPHHSLHGTWCMFCSAASPAGCTNGPKEHGLVLTCISRRIRRRYQNRTGLPAVRAMDYRKFGNEASIQASSMIRECRRRIESQTSWEMEPGLRTASLVAISSMTQSESSG